MINVLELYGKRRCPPDEITLRCFKATSDKDAYIKEFTKDDGIMYRRFVEVVENETIKV